MQSNSPIADIRAPAHGPGAPVPFWSIPLPGGFTLLELLVVVVILGVLSTMGLTAYRAQIAKAQNTKAIADLRFLEREILAYQAHSGRLPQDLETVGRDRMIDPWGSPYQYLNFETIGNKGKGKMRKDRFLVPLNTDFDLYSMGPDGRSVPPLTAKHSHDDLIRANNGVYIGPAANY